MLMGKTGQALVFHEITKHIDIDNIDRVALALSRKNCENFFGILATFSCGNQVFFGQTNSWET